MANSSDFKLLDRKVVDVLNKMPKRGFFRAISYWVAAAGSVVVKDVAKNAIVAGVPAKAIGYKDKNNLNFQG